jgi:hypothetical protein
MPFSLLPRSRARQGLYLAHFRPEGNTNGAPLGFKDEMR